MTTKRIAVGILGTLGFLLMCCECDTFASTLGIKAAAALLWLCVLGLCNIWHEDL